MTHDGSTHCALCSEPLPAGEVGVCERHLTEPLDERWADCRPSVAKQTEGLALHGDGIEDDWSLHS